MSKENKFDGFKGRVRTTLGDNKNNVVHLDRVSRQIEEEAKAAAAEEPKPEAQQPRQSIEIDMKDLGRAPTVEHQSVPPAAPPAEPGPASSEVPAPARDPRVDPLETMDVSPSMRLEPEVVAEAKKIEEARVRQQQITMDGPAAMPAGRQVAPAAIAVAENTGERKFFDDPPHEPREPMRAMEMPAATGWRLWWENNGRTVAAVLGAAVVLGTATLCLVVLVLSQLSPGRPSDITARSERVTEPAHPEPQPVVVVPVPNPAPVVRSGDPGLTGPRGSYVQIRAHDAFPTTCATAGNIRRTDGVTFLCDRGEYHGANVCDCDASGRVP